MSNTKKLLTLQTDQYLTPKTKYYEIVPSITKTICLSKFTIRTSPYIQCGDEHDSLGLFKNTIYSRNLSSSGGRSRQLKYWAIFVT